MASLPKPSLDLIAHEIQSNWSGDYAGHYREWYHTTISIFLASGTMPDDAENDELDGWVGMGSQQTDMANNAFRIWSEYVGLNFVLTNDNEDADITFGYSTTTEKGGSYTTPEIGDKMSDIGYGSYAIEDEDIWMAVSPANWPELVEGAFSYGARGLEVFLHEIGHALGLSHPGPYDASEGTPTYADADFPQDSMQYTIMSYFGGYEDGKGWIPVDDPTYKPGPEIYWQTPTIYDIYAIQSKYGVNTTTRSGETTYGFHSQGTGWDGVDTGLHQAYNLYDFTKNTKPLLSIVDSGGIDTLDLSGYSGAQTIDLTPGNASSVMGMTENVWISFNTTIENAVGGGGGDVIIGNGADNTLMGNAGNDTLTGGNGLDMLDGGADDDILDAGGSGLGLGAETLTGGTGSDIFIYNKGYRHEVITDFDASADMLDVRGQSMHNFADIMSVATQVGSDVVIDFGNISTGPSDQLTLENFNLDDLDAGMFHFSEDNTPLRGDFLAVANPSAQNFYPFWTTSAALGDGGFMAVEVSTASYPDKLMAHRFDARGVDVGQFQINTTSFSGSGLDATTAIALPSGNFLVFWDSNDTGGGGVRCIRARLFDSDANPLGDDFVVNTTPAVTQTDGTGYSIYFDGLVRSLSGGVIARWRSDVIPGSESYQVHFFERGFDTNGNPVGNDIDLGAPHGEVGDPTMPPSMSAGREFVLADGDVLHWWAGYVGGDTSQMHILAQLGPDDPIVQVDSGNYLGGLEVDASQLADGRIVFSWEDNRRVSQYTVYSPGAAVAILDSDLQGFTKPGTDAAETLTGSIDNDRLYGLGGDDLLIGGRGPDILDGGNGSDTVSYEKSLAPVDVRLDRAGAQSGGQADGDVLISIENVIGTSYNDTLYGNEQNNTIMGGYGRDTILGGGGNDRLAGGRGSDLVLHQGALDNYKITYDAASDTFTVADLRDGAPEGIDTETGFETFRFSDGVLTRQDLIDHVASTTDHPASPGNDQYNLIAGQTLTVNATNGLLANDVALDGGAKVVGVTGEFGVDYAMSITDPNSGTLTVAADGSLSFAMAQGSQSSYFTFRYRIQDNDGSTGEANITIALAPDAIDDLYQVNGHKTLSVNAAHGLLANDQTPEEGSTILGLVSDDEVVHGMSMTNAGEGTLTVDYDGSLSFTAEAGFAGKTSFEYKLYGYNGYDTATVAFDVGSGANIAPTGANKTVTIKEDASYKFKANDFGFSDSDGDHFAGIVVASLPSSGKFLLDGQKVLRNEHIDLADIGHLVWTPASDDSGKGLANFMFKVMDDGGTDGGGHNIASIARKITFNVIEVTDVFNGKKGADTFVGTADHDIFDSKGGNDKLTGKGGSDTFIFAVEYDKDTITDFTTAGKAHDIIDLSRLTAIANFADLKAHHFSDHGKDTWIDGGDGDILVLKATDISDLNKSDFLF